MKFNRKQRRLYERLKHQDNDASNQVKPSKSWLKLGHDLHISLRQLRLIVKLLKSHGLIDSNYQVPVELYGLKLSQVQIKSGEQMLIEKAKRREQFFARQGSMRLASKLSNATLSFKPKFAEL